MSASALLERSDEVAELVMEQAIDLVGKDGIVGGALAIDDPNAEMPFFVRLYLDRVPGPTAASLPRELVVNLPFRGPLTLPVRAEYTGPFNG